MRTPDPDILRELVKDRVVQLWDGQTHRASGIITQPPRRGLQVSGEGLVRLLGVGDVGPTIRDRWYLSGLSRLANGNFELVPVDLYWSLPEDSAWALTVGFAQIAAGRETSDALESTQTIEVEPGQQWTVSGTAERAGTPGRLRLQPELRGRFAPAEHLPNAGFEAGAEGTWNDITGDGVMQIVNDPANARTGNFAVRIGPHPRPNLLPNGSFETGPDNADELAQGWLRFANPSKFELAAPEGAFDNAPRSGSEALKTKAPWPSVGIHTAGQSDNGDYVQFVGPQPPNAGITTLEAGERYCLRGYVKNNSDNGDTEEGECWLSVRFLVTPPVDQVAFCESGSPTGDSEITAGPRAKPRTTEWQEIFANFTPPDGYTNLYPRIEVSEVQGPLITDTFDSGSPASTSYQLSSLVGEEAWDAVDVELEVDGVHNKEYHFAAGSPNPNLVLEATPADNVPVKITYRAPSGSFIFDDFSIVAHHTPWSKLAGPSFAIETGRSYRPACWVRQDEQAVGGEVRLAIILTDSLGFHDEQVLHSATVSDTDHEWTELAHEFTCPDGWDGMRLELHSRNVERGYWWLDDTTTKATDTSTFEDWAGMPALRWSENDVGVVTKTRTITIPEGADTLVLRWVAETGGGDMTVTGTSAIRTDQAPATLGQILQDLVTDPTTGRALLTLGNVEGGGRTIPFDKRFRFVTCRQALDALTRIFPGDEWRVTKDGRLDFGSPSFLFAVSDLILHDTQIQTVTRPEAEETTEEEATRIVVLGAELTDARGGKRLISGEAATGVTVRNLAGESVERERVVQASEMDTPDAAQAFADYLASRQVARLQVQAEISDPSALPVFEVDGWVQALDVDQGLTDAANRRQMDGQDVFPLAMRVLEVETVADFRLLVLREDGSTYEIPADAVERERASTVRFTLGDLLPEFTSDPDGGPVGQQLLRYRAAVAR